MATLALVAIAAACGGGDDDTREPPPADAVPVDTWVADVCGSLTDYAERVGTIADDLRSEADAEPAVAKDALVALYSEAAAATDALIVELDAAGVPDVGDGTEIGRGLVGLFEQIGDAYRSAVTDAQALDPTDADEFDADVQALAAALDDAQAGLDDPFGDLDSPEELNDAADAEPSCGVLAI